MEYREKQRMTRAVLGELHAHGRTDFSLERAAAESGVAVGVLEAELGGRDACLATAYRETGERLIADTTALCDAERSWPARVRDGLQIVLREIAADPVLAEAVTRSYPALDPAAYQHYVELLSAFEPYLAEGRSYVARDAELPDKVELLAIGSAEAIIFSELEAGRAKELPGMAPEILFSVLVPFLGPDRAVEEMRSAEAAH